MIRGEDCKNCLFSKFSDDDLLNYDTLIKCYNENAFPSNIFLRSNYMIIKLCRHKKIIIIQTKLF